MAKVALDGTINIQGTKEIDRTNLAQLREPRTNDKGDCGRTVVDLTMEDWVDAGLKKLEAKDAMRAIHGVDSKPTAAGLMPADVGLTVA
jgi:hypothetical protein